MARFIALDLAGLPAPDIIETLDFETIRQELLDDMNARMAALGLNFDAQSLESDPAVKILEVAADREVILRARVNGACKALLLALARQNDLQHLGALFGVQRQTITPATTDVNGLFAPAVMESDDRLRTRIQLAPQAFSVAGPVGAYEFNVMLAAPTVTSVGIVSPYPGQVYVYPMVSTGDGTPSPDVLNAIRLQLLADDVRPLTDQVTVMPAKMQYVDVNVVLVAKRGPDVGVLMSMAKTALQAYADARHTVGAGFYLSGLYQAAQLPGVEHVIIVSPTQDIDPGPSGAVYVNSITVSSQVIST
jgi:phage-related baseplate assembly protein